MDKLIKHFITEQNCSWFTLMRGLIIQNRLICNLCDRETFQPSAAFEKLFEAFQKHWIWKIHEKCWENLLSPLWRVFAICHPNRLRLGPPQDDVSEKQSQEETAEGQHDAAAVLLFCRGMSRLDLLMNHLFLNMYIYYNASFIRQHDSWQHWFTESSGWMTRFIDSWQRRVSRVDGLWLWRPLLSLSSADIRVLSLSSLSAWVYIWVCVLPIMVRA